MGDDDRSRFLAHVVAALQHVGIDVDAEVLAATAGAPATGVPEAARRTAITC